MAKKPSVSVGGASSASLAPSEPKSRRRGTPPSESRARPSALLDTRVIYCGDCLEQLRRLPSACVDPIYIDPPFNSNRNYEVFWGETREIRAFEDRHAAANARKASSSHSINRMGVRRFEYLFETKTQKEKL